SDTGMHTRAQIDYKNGRIYMSGHIGVSTPDEEFWQTTETYIEDDGGICRVYSSIDGGEWEEDDTANGKIFEDYFDGIYSIFEMFMNEYNNFEYDADSGVYLAYNLKLNEILCDRVAIRFDNGRVIEIEMAISAGDGSSLTQTIWVDNYDNTVVDVPKIA
ncbi:MAG: hypothetical protein K2L54_02215, partial [Clostridiales bacterium]|nr:hypothetical protein [Clostridiales bacterium]